MKGHICIGVAHEALVVWNLDPAEPHCVALGEVVNVIAGANARFHPSVSADDPLRPRKVVGMGDLDIVPVPGNHDNAQARPFSDFGIIRKLAPHAASAHMRGEELAEAESLRRLSCVKLPAIFRCRHLVAICRALDGVGYGQRRQCSLRGTERFDHPIDQRLWHERSCCVLDQHQIGLQWRKGSQPCQH